MQLDQRLAKTRTRGARCGTPTILVVALAEASTISCSAFRSIRRVGVFFGAGLCARTFISLVAASSGDLRLAFDGGSILRLRASLSRTSRLGNSTPILQARSATGPCGGVSCAEAGGKPTLADPFAATVGDEATASAIGAGTVTTSSVGAGARAKAAGGIVAIGMEGAATGRGASVPATLGAIAVRSVVARVATAAAAKAAVRADITALDSPSFADTSMIGEDVAAA